MFKSITELETTRYAGMAIRKTAHLLVTNKVRFVFVIKKYREQIKTNPALAALDMLLAKCSRTLFL